MASWQEGLDLNRIALTLHNKSHGHPFVFSVLLMQLCKQERTQSMVHYYTGAQTPISSSKKNNSLQLNIRFYPFVLMCSMGQHHISASEGERLWQCFREEIDSETYEQVFLLKGTPLASHLPPPKKQHKQWSDDPPPSLRSRKSSHR